jgi:hypothetical protein
VKVADPVCLNVVLTTTSGFTLERTAFGDLHYGHVIKTPAGTQVGPNFGDSNGPREAQPWLAALEAAFLLGAKAEAARADRLQTCIDAVHSELGLAP